jgi:hypothetical protein
MTPEDMKEMQHHSNLKNLVDEGIALSDETVVEARMIKLKGSKLKPDNPITAIQILETFNKKVSTLNEFMISLPFVIENLKNKGSDEELENADLILESTKKQFKLWNNQLQKESIK